MTQNTNIAQTRLGNTNKARSRNWILTINNPDENTKNQIFQKLNRNGFKFIYQLEVGEQGTEHIQGFIESKNPRTFDSIKTMFPTAHIEKCKKREAAARYCKKENTRGEPDFHTNMSPQELGEATTDKKSKKQKKEEEMGPEPPLEDDIEGKTLYPFQQKIMDIINGPVDPRKIYWIADDGNKGKTSLARHICIKHPHEAIYVNGKAADIKHGIAEFVNKVGRRFRIAIFGFPRSVEDYVSYQALEEVKDGIFFSGKFESGMCIYNKPHIICLANFLPDTTKMTNDRWVIDNNMTKTINLNLDDLEME